VRPFTYSAHSNRIIFGAGSLAGLPVELEALGISKALVLTTPHQAALGERVAHLVGARSVGVFSDALMHVPIETAIGARAVAARLGADGCIAVGGGSTLGLAKAIALTSSLPIVAVPTTYAGSEVTPIYGLTEGGLKKTGRDLRVLPRVVIYDPELTLTLPYFMSITSGMNAIAHAAEGLYANDASPIVSLMATEALRAMADALPRIQTNPHDIAARSDALYGAWLAGTVLGQVSMGLHHKLCHTLGGSFGLPHAETHTVILPHALAYNAAAAPQAMNVMARALGVDHAPQGLQRLASQLGAPLSLRDLGMLENDLDLAADLAIKTPYPNPRTLDRNTLRGLLQRAWDGAPPS
jgi:maleylacetate reductase